jgi:hypothetical protein
MSAFGGKADIGRIPTGAAPIDEDQNARNLERAHELWNEAESIADTLAERYLAETRGIDVGALPGGINEVLRFHPRCWLGGKYPPCLIALFRDIETGERAGIHRTWLTADAQKIDRRMFGRWPRPRAIKLWPADNRLFVGEGIETALAAATQLGMRPAWALGSKIYLSKLPVISGVNELTILVDHDADGEAAAIACDQTWRDAGRRVRLLRTKDAELNDFNDLILKTPRAEWGSGFDEVENTAHAPQAAAAGTNGGTPAPLPPGAELIEPVDLWGQFDPPALPLGFLPEVIERLRGCGSHRRRSERHRRGGADGLRGRTVGLRSAASQEARCELVGVCVAVGRADWQSEHQEDADHSARG